MGGLLGGQFSFRAGDSSTVGSLPSSESEDSKELSYRFF